MQSQLIVGIIAISIRSKGCQTSWHAHLHISAIHISAIFAWRMLMLFAATSCNSTQFNIHLSCCFLFCVLNYSRHKLQQLDAHVVDASLLLIVSGCHSDSTATTTTHRPPWQTESSSLPQDPLHGLCHCLCSPVTITKLTRCPQPLQLCWYHCH